VGRSDLPGLRKPFGQGVGLIAGIGVAVIVLANDRAHERAVLGATDGPAIGTFAGVALFLTFVGCLELSPSTRNR